jgi:hypothetical protein
MANRQDRIARAAAALSTYRELSGGWGPEEESLTDLLTDLMHLVDELLVDREIGRTFDDMLGTARMHYGDER